MEEPSETPETIEPSWSPYYWCTADEVRFVEGLGTHRLRGPGPHPPLQPKERLAALVAYRDAMPRRARWGHVDAMVVAGYVDREVDKLTAQLHGPKPARLN